jgi:hypothetical protein
MHVESQACWDHRFGNANAVELTKAKLFPEAMHSWSAHTTLRYNDADTTEDYNRPIPILTGVADYWNAV